jgi:hypothetical protein
MYTLRLHRSLKGLFGSRSSWQPDAVLAAILPPKRPLSAESMELVEQLAHELKRECSMARNGSTQTPIYLS